MVKVNFVRGMFLAGLLMSAVFARAGVGAGCGQMPVGFHEFGIFGGSGHVFISHYPMFSSIHAYQVLLEVELSSDDHDAQRKFLDFLSAHPDTKFTYSPYRKTPVATDRAKDQDDWVLSEKARYGALINGDIHYQDNHQDTTLDFNVGAKVTRVIQNRILLPGVARPKELTYVLFGDPSALFLAHYVSAPANPGEQISDFDQILTISPSVAVAPTALDKLYTVSNRANDKSAQLNLGETVNLTGADGGQIEIKVSSLIFNHSIMTDR